MGKLAQQKRRDKQIELLKHFDGDYYQEKRVNGQWYIKNFNGNTKNWQVSKYTDQSYRRYKQYQSYNNDKETFEYKIQEDDNFERPTLENLSNFMS